MRTRAWLRGSVLLLVASTLTLTPLAYDTPPDPTWELAYFDDLDFDDVVRYLITASGLVDEPLVHSLRPLPVLIALESPQQEEPVSSVPLSATGPRAPPSA